MTKSSRSLENNSISKSCLDLLSRNFGKENALEILEIANAKGIPPSIIEIISKEKVDEPKEKLFQIKLLLRGTKNPKLTSKGFLALIKFLGIQEAFKIVNGTKYLSLPLLTNLDFFEEVLKLLENEVSKNDSIIKILKKDLNNEILNLRFSKFLAESIQKSLNGKKGQRQRERVNKKSSFTISKEQWEEISKAKISILKIRDWLDEKLPEAIIATPILYQELGAGRVARLKVLLSEKRLKNEEIISILKKMFIAKKLEELTEFIIPQALTPSLLTKFVKDIGIFKTLEMFKCLAIYHIPKNTWQEIAKSVYAVFKQNAEGFDIVQTTEKFMKGFGKNKKIA